MSSATLGLFFTGSFGSLGRLTFCALLYKNHFHAFCGNYKRNDYTHMHFVNT